MSYCVGVIGTGRLGGAVLLGLKRAGFSRAEVIATAPRNQVPALSLNEAAVFCSDVSEIIDKASIILVCVRPGQVGDLLKAYREDLNNDQSLAILSAGVSFGVALDLLSGRTLELSRVITSVNIASGSGFSVIYAQGREIPRIRSLMAKLGAVLVASTERDLEDISLISGTLPALIALFQGSVVDWVVKGGVPRVLAEDLVLRAILGTVRTESELQLTTDQLVDLVCTPGGLTESAVRSIKLAGFEEFAGAWFNGLRKKGREENV